MPQDELLTSRRREIAVLLTEGRTLDEIARMLTVTLEAVADDVEYLLQRLDPASRAEVASWAGAPMRRLWTVQPASRVNNRCSGAIPAPRTARTV